MFLRKTLPVFELNYCNTRVSLEKLNEIVHTWLAWWRNYYSSGSRSNTKMNNTTKESVNSHFSLKWFLERFAVFLRYLTYFLYIWTLISETIHFRVSCHHGNGSIRRHGSQFARNQNRLAAIDGRQFRGQKARTRICPIGEYRRRSKISFRRNIGPKSCQKPVRYRHSFRQKPSYFDPRWPKARFHLYQCILYRRLP